jgi:hypothetical protein
MNFYFIERITSNLCYVVAITTIKIFASVLINGKSLYSLNIINILIFNYSLVRTLRQLIK